MSVLGSRSAKSLPPPSPKSGASFSSSLDWWSSKKLRAPARVRRPYTTQNGATRQETAPRGSPTTTEDAAEGEAEEREDTDTELTDLQKTRLPLPKR